MLLKNYNFNLIILMNLTRKNTKKQNTSSDKNYRKASEDTWLFTKLVCCSTNKHSNHKMLWVLTEQNISQTEQEQRAHLHSLPHEKCIILSPVASLCLRKSRGKRGSLFVPSADQHEWRENWTSVRYWQPGGSQSELLHSSSRIRMNCTVYEFCLGSCDTATHQQFVE